MQIYKYNDDKTGPLFKKVYSQELPFKLKIHTLAHNLFDIIDTLSQQAPPGTLPLNRIYYIVM